MTQQNPTDPLRQQRPGSSRRPVQWPQAQRPEHLPKQGDRPTPLPDRPK